MQLKGTQKKKQESLTSPAERELWSVEGSAEWSWSAAELHQDSSMLVSTETAPISHVRETLGPLRPAQTVTVISS